MQILRSKLSVDIIWNLFSLGVLATSGLLINVLLAVRADAAALGVFNQAFAVFIFAAQFAVGGVQYSVLKVLSTQGDEPDRQRLIIGAALAPVAISGLFVSGVLYLLAPLIGAILSSSEVSLGVQWIAPGIALFALNKVLVMSLNGLRRMRAYAVFQSLRYLLIVIALWLLLENQAPPWMLPAALSIGETCLLLCLSVYFVLAKLYPVLSRSSGALIREHVSFGIRGFASGLIIEINTRLDVLMLGIFYSDSIVGAYSFAATLIEGFRLVPSVIRWNLDPVLGRCIAEKDDNRIRELIVKFKIGVGSAMAVVMLVAALTYQPILSLLHLPPEVIDSSIYFWILAVGVVASSFYAPFYGLLLQGGLPGLHSLMTAILLGQNAILNLLFILSVGDQGAAIATATVFASEGLLLRYFARQRLGIKL